MLARMFGVPLAFIVFFVVVFATGNSFGSGLPLIIGAAAGGIVWLCFKCLDKRRLEMLLRPPATIWQVPLPVAWGVLKDVFDGSIIRTKDGVIAAWTLKRDDKSRGLMSAMLNFLEHGGCGPQGPSEPRTIAANAELTAQGASTGVKLTFDVFSPGCSELVEDIVRKCRQKLASEVREYAISGSRGESPVAGRDLAGRENRYD